MKFIVCGAGRVGFGIAKELAQENNGVTMIDLSEEAVEQASVSLDVRGVVGHGAHPDVLARAGANDADMLIAVTQSDEVNMVACQVAHSLFQVPNKIARVRAQSYLDGQWGALFNNKNLPIDVVISPEREVGRAIVRRLETPGAFNTMPFGDGRVRVLGIKLDDDCPVLATPLSQLRKLFPDLKAVVAGVRRDERLFTPHPADQLLEGDEIYVFADSNHEARTLDIFGRTVDRARRAVIIGGGNIGVYVARELEATPGMRVRMIEADKERAEHAAEALGRTVVLKGDGLDQAIQSEAGVPEAEVVICLTNDDKVNVLAAALAKRQGARRSLCLVNDQSYQGLKEPLGVDVFIDPRATSVSTVLQHVRRGRILGLQFIDDGAAEIIEGVALETSPLVGRTLHEATGGEGAIAGAVIRGDEVIIGADNEKVRPGDRLVVFAERQKVAKIEKFFRVAVEFF